MTHTDVAVLLGRVVMAIWWVATILVAIRGCVGLVRRWRARRRGLIIPGLLVCVGVWALPASQRGLGRPHHERLLEQLLMFTGRSLAEVSDRFGPPEQNHHGAQWYDSSPWYAPLDTAFVRLVSLSGESLDHAYVDRD